MWKIHLWRKWRSVQGRCCYGISVFSTKIELVIETAEFYWQKVAEKYLTELEQTDTGYVQLQKIMNVLERIFQEEKAFLKFYRSLMFL